MTIKATYVVQSIEYVKDEELLRGIERDSSIFLEMRKEGLEILILTEYHEGKRSRRKQ